MPIQALFTALSGLQVIQQSLNVTSDNIANAQTPGYTRKTLPLSTLVTSNTAEVQAGTVIRNVDSYLQTDYWNQVSSASFFDTQSTYLTNLQQISGKPSDAGSMASLLGTIAGDFTQLSANPSSSSAQQQVVVDAGNFARSVNKLAGYVQTERNTAQSDIQSSVQTINTDLGQIAQLNQAIAQAHYAGQSTANLEDQRDNAIQDLSGQMSISTFTRSDGVTVVQTATGQLLADTVAQPVAFQTSTLGVNSYYPASANGIIVGTGAGAFDLAAGSPGGKLGALLNLRDQVLPQQQAQLDELSEQTANRFSAQGLDLFTDQNGAIPANVPGSYVGFAQQLQVNPLVQANATLVQQGTGGGSLSPGDNSLILNIVNFTFGDNQSAGPPPVPNVPFNTSGLGPNGSVASSGLPAVATLQSYASQIIAGQGSTLSAVQTQQTSEGSYRDALGQSLTNTSGVNLDTEMSNMLAIQRAYGACAQMMKTATAMFDDLLNAIH